MQTPPLTVEMRPDGIVVYRLRDQTPAALIEWIRRVSVDVAAVRRAQQTGGQPVVPWRILHDLRKCGTPRGSLLSHLSVGLRTGRDLTMRCAVVGQDRIAISIFKRLLNVPSEGGVDTLSVPTLEQMWSPRAEICFFDNIDEAERWLSNVPAAL